VERSALSILLDTATWLNAFMIPEVLPARVRNIIRNHPKKRVSSISLLEAAILHRRGRIQIRGTLVSFFAEAVADDVELIEMSPVVAAATNDLPSYFHGDPFDRAIAATARVFDFTLITPDPAIRDAGFCKVEFYPFKPGRAKSA
jgi:PIN domain nuclease of toxin-antitoxin system